MAIDFTRAEGQTLVGEPAVRSDVLLENYKVGGLATGCGQTGPYAGRPGYDLLIQAAVGRLMSITGGATTAPAAARRRSAWPSPT